MTKRLDPGLIDPSSSSSIGAFLESPAGALFDHCQHENSSIRPYLNKFCLPIVATSGGEATVPVGA